MKKKKKKKKGKTPHLSKSQCLEIHIMGRATIAVRTYRSYEDHARQQRSPDGSSSSSTQNEMRD